MQTTIFRVFVDLENGNLIDAKARAKRFSQLRLSMYALEYLGYSFALSSTAAAYLKGEGTFQAYCDAK